MTSSSNQPINVGICHSDNIQWIHCNSCYKLYERNHSFYLLSCSHVLCRSCFKKGGRDPICTICKKNVSFKIMNDQLEPKYLKLFKPEMNYDSYVEEFQYTHALDLAKQIARAERIAEENQNDMKKLIEYNERYKMLRAQRKQKQNELKKLYTMSRQRQISKKPIEREHASEFGNSRVLNSRSLYSQSSSAFTIPSIIDKSTSFNTSESAKQFFQNRAPSSTGKQLSNRKAFDLSAVCKFNKYFKPPTKSTPL